MNLLRAGSTQGGVGEGCKTEGVLQRGYMSSPKARGSDLCVIVVPIPGRCGYRNTNRKAFSLGIVT